MRELKFRAWSDTDGGAMLEVGDAYGTVHPLDCCGYFVEGQPVTLMQYTGLKDSKGVDIYEGDIVYLAGLGDMEVDYPYLDLCQAEIDGDIGEIKGNIYENKELLEK